MDRDRTFDEDFRPQSAPPVLTYAPPSQPGGSNKEENYLASYEYYCHWQQNQHNPRLRPPTVDWRVSYEQEIRSRTVDYQQPPFPGPMPTRSEFNYPDKTLSDGTRRDEQPFPIDLIQKDFPRTPSPPLDPRRVGAGEAVDRSGRTMNGPPKKPQKPPARRADVLKPIPHSNPSASEVNGVSQHQQQPTHPMGHQPLPFPLPPHLSADPATPTFSASFSQYGDLPMSPLTPQRSLSDGSISPMFSSPMQMARHAPPQSPMVPYMSPTIMNTDGVAQQPMMAGYGAPNQMDHLTEQFRQTHPFYDNNFPSPEHSAGAYDRRGGMPMRAVLGESPMYGNQMPPDNHFQDSSPQGFDRFGMESRPYSQFGSDVSSMPMVEGQNGETNYGPTPGNGQPTANMNRGGGGSSVGPMSGSNVSEGPRMTGGGQSRDWDYDGDNRGHGHRGRRGQHGRGRFGSHRENNSSDFDARQLMRGNATLHELIAGERVVSLACDQNGSRFIQTCLEKASEDEKQAVFDQIFPETLRLCADVFGNYVIQKFFEYGSERHKMELARCLMGRVLPLSLSMYGCRVIQKALECVNESMRVTLVQELMGHVEQCVRDQNGNHVIQKCIEEVPNEHLGFICSTFVGKVFEFSTHPYGCRVIQRLLEHSTRDDELIENEHTPEHRRILQEILQHIVALSKDQYGNYVVQHVLEHGPSNARDRIVSMVLGHVLPLSKHKFASNVVEKAFVFAKREDQKEALLDELIGTEDNSPLPTMVRDQYANYVIQTVLGTLGAPQRSKLIKRMNEFVPNLRKFIYGKHIVNKIEQLTGRRM